MLVCKIPVTDQRIFNQGNSCHGLQFRVWNISSSVSDL